jgi:thiosulfate/3-mercaptopyruvate sulfurtransferase
VSTLANALAMEIAGYPPVPLYAGSWSEWSRTPGLPWAIGST